MSWAPGCWRRNRVRWLAAISAYWATAETVNDEEPSIDRSGNVIALIR